MFPSNLFSFFCRQIKKVFIFCVSLTFEMDVKSGLSTFSKEDCGFLSFSLENQPSCCDNQPHKSCSVLYSCSVFSRVIYNGGETMLTKRNRENGQLQANHASRPIILVSDTFVCCWLGHFTKGTGMKHFGQLLSKQLWRFVDIAEQRRKPSTGSQMWVECKVNSKEKLFWETCHWR